MFGISVRRYCRAIAVAVTAIALAFHSGGTAFAQELAPEHLALAREYVDLTDTASVYEVSLVETGIATMRTLLSQNPGLSDPVNTAVEQVLATYKDQKGELLDQFARVYALRFTIEELREMVAFYSSPTGKKLAESNSDVNIQLQTVMQVYEANMKPEFFAKVRAQLKAAGVNL